MEAAIGRFSVQIERPGALKYASPIVLVPELFTTHVHLAPLTGYLANGGWEVYVPDLRSAAGNDGTPALGRIDFQGALALAEEALAAIGRDAIVIGHGIGGLLARTDANGSTFYHSDGSGNITALIDATQNIVARYEYNPFGKLIGKWGALADVNRYRFSSKEIHPLSGLYSYGFRFYEPSFQRWLNRDPIGEGGGLNLSQFVGNSPVNEIDPLGLEGNPVSSTLPGVSGSWNSDAYGPGGSFYDPGNGWRPPVGNAMNPQDVRDQIMGELNPPPFPYPPSWPYPDGANGWDPNTGQWLYPSEGLQIDPIMEAIALSAAASLRGATLRPCPPVKAAIKPAGSLVSSSVRAFLRGEKALSELSAAEKEQAIRGFEQAAEDARDAADAAYQRARAAALRGEGPPPGSLQQWRQNYGQK